MESVVMAGKRNRKRSRSASAANAAIQKNRKCSRTNWRTLRIYLSRKPAFAPKKEQTRVPHFSHLLREVGLIQVPEHFLSWAHPDISLRQQLCFLFAGPTSRK